MSNNDLEKKEALAELEKLLKEDREKNKYYNEFWMELRKRIIKFQPVLKEDEFNSVVNELLQNENYSIDFLKKDYFYGLFDSFCTGALPKEFVELFENGYHGDNKELLYKLNYLDCGLTDIFMYSKDYAMCIVEQCVELAK